MKYIKAKVGNLKLKTNKLMNKTILISIIVVILIVLVGGYFLFYNSNQGSLYGTTQNNNQQNGVTVSNSKVLDLSNQGLTSIPMSVFNQTNLEELNVSHNSLTGAIQSQIGQLKNLKVLNASYNQMTGVPAEVGQLQNLQVLDLSYNQLTGLPNELGNLKNLKTLNLTGNSYSQQDLNGIKSKLPSTTNIIVSQQPVNTQKLTASVSIKNFAFNPKPLNIKVGTTVTWTNNDPMAHQIKSATFNSSPLSNGQTFSFTFSTAGTYNYSCAIHPSMLGKIVVSQ
jgi:plastocyanin